MEVLAKEVRKCDTCFALSANDTNTGSSAACDERKT